jgi:hypothetical protein
MPMAIGVGSWLRSDSATHRPTPGIRSTLPPGADRPYVDVLVRLSDRRRWVLSAPAGVSGTRQSGVCSGRGHDVTFPLVERESFHKRRACLARASGAAEHHPPDP